MRENLGTNGTNGDAWPQGWLVDVASGGTATIQSNKLRLVSPATSSARTRAEYQRPYADMEFLCRITPGQTWATDARIIVGMRNDFVQFAGSTDAWRLEIDGGSAPFYETIFYVAATGTPMDTPALTLTASNPIWVRFRKQGNSVSAKVWDDGTNEPAAWTSSSLASNGPSASLMYPYLDNLNPAVATARTFDVDNITLDDLRPIRVRTNFRRGA